MHLFFEIFLNHFPSHPGGTNHALQCILYPPSIVALTAGWHLFVHTNQIERKISDYLLLNCECPENRGQVCWRRSSKRHDCQVTHELDKGNWRLPTPPLSLQCAFYLASSLPEAAVRIQL